LALLAPAAHAACRAVIVSGDPGAETPWAHQFDDWRARWQKLLTQTYAIPAANVTILHHADSAAPDAATRTNVLAALASLVQNCTPDDQAVLVIIAHAYHGQDGLNRICLPGPHLSETDLANALRGLKAGRLVAILLAPDSKPFAKALRGPNRVIILGNINPSAGYFGEFLLRALAPGNVNLLDAFNASSLENTHWYQNQFVDHGSGVVTVHGKDFQQLFQQFYPDRTMTAGDDQPQPANNDPAQAESWAGRRIVPEVAGLEDNGDGEPSTLFLAGEAPTPLPNKEAKDGALAKTTILGRSK
jgi:hypothetical protein